jgi:hypothetical protein
MFTKAFTFCVLAAASISSVVASPINLAGRTNHEVSIPRFSDWHGLSSLHGFDDFYGYNNFAGISHRQVILKQKKELVCHRQQIVIIQQRLAVLREMVKKVITETICEVETQTVVFEQFHSGLGSFHHDLRRKSGRRVGYDAHVAGLYHGIFDEHGSVSNYDLGFRGNDIGKHVISVGGHDWDDFKSPPLVESAYDAARKAVITTGGDEEDVELPEVSTDSVPDTEVDDASDAPPPEESAADDGDNTAIVTDSVSASASATASATSSAASESASANVDPATAP